LDSGDITQGDLDDIFNSMFNCKEKSADAGRKVMDVLEKCADECLPQFDEVNLQGHSKVGSTPG
jgi:hypothetical protein